jgi:dipeptidyl aminopeptidase/acylaminoacyl peptidase
VVQTDRQRKYVAIMPGHSGHATMVAGSAAGSRGKGGRYDGLAPGAQLVLIDYGLGGVCAMVEALIDAFADPRVDLVLFEQHINLAMPYRLGDGRFPATIITTRLIDKYKKPQAAGVARGQRPDKGGWGRSRRAQDGSDRHRRHCQSGEGGRVLIPGSRLPRSLGRTRRSPASMPRDEAQAEARATADTTRCWGERCRAHPSVFVLLLLVSLVCVQLAAQEIFLGPRFDPRSLSLPSKQGTNRRAIDTTDLVTRRRFLGASISPDGRFFSYAVVQAQIAENNYRTALALAATTDPARVRILGSAGRPRWNYVGEYFQESPQWSPDSQYLTYTVQTRGPRQVWRWSVDGGPGEQLTRGPLDVLHYRWLQDGSGFMYSTRSRPPNTADPSSSDPIRYEDTTMGNYGLPLLDRDEVSSPEVKLWIYDLKGMTSRAATDRDVKRLGGGFESPFGSTLKTGGSLSADGRLLVDIESVPDSNKNTSDAHRMVFKEAVTGKVVTKSEALLAAPTIATWKPDSRSVLVYWSQAFGTQGLYEVSVEVEGLRPVLAPFSEFLSGCSFTRSVDQALCFTETATSLKRLVLVDLEARRATTAADINPEFQGLRFGQPTLMSWANKYGDERHGWLILPVDYAEGTRYPLLLTSYYFPGTFLNGNGDEFPLQVFANRGFVVLCVHTPPQRRRDQGFVNALLDWESPTASFEAIIRILDERGIINPEQVGITGLSYGAELTEYAISHSEAFAAAASTSAGSHDPGRMYTADRTAREYYYGPKIGLLGWWEGDVYAQRWSRFSTLLNATKIRCPWLIQAADREYMGAVPLFNRLRELGKPIELWIYPDEFHIKNQPRNRLVAQERYLDWFKFWLEGEEDLDPAKREHYSRWRAMRDASGRRR